MRIDFRGVTRPSKGLLPDGWYQAAAKSVQPKQASSGLEFWRLEFEVTEGERVGAHVFENLFFSEKALPRLKLALSSLGLPHEGLVDVMPDELVGRRCWIEVKSEVGSDQKVRNVVTFEGYRPATTAPQARTEPRSTQAPRRANAEAEGDVPF